MAAIAPMAVPHRAMSDIDIRGYKIPKVNTLVLLDFDPQYEPNVLLRRIQ